MEFLSLLDNSPGFSSPGFMESTRNFEASRMVLLGAPMDYTASYRPGSRGAPQKIRQVSRVLEEHSMFLGRDLGQLEFFDGGDLTLPPGNVEKSLEIIERAWRLLLQEGKLPFMIGGDHLVTYPAVKAAAEACENLALLQLDAHADLRDTYMGESNSHASVIYRIFKETGVRDIYQLGIRSATGDEVAFARQNTRLFPCEIVEPLKKIKKELSRRPVYVTLDIDVVDPAFAPGTGTPEPGGCSSREILEAVHQLRDFQVIGIDLVEVTPASDCNEITSLLAAKIIREALLILG